VEYVQPTVGRLNAGKPGLVFFNFPVIKENIKTIEVSSFIVNNNNFFTIIFNDGKSRWCYANEKQRNADYLKLIGAPDIDTDIELDFINEEKFVPEDMDFDLSAL